MAIKIKVTQTRSVIGRPEDQKKTVKSLGLRGIRSSRVLEDSHSIRGMVRKVQHLVAVEVVE